MGSEKPATIELDRDGEAVTLSWVRTQTPGIVFPLLTALKEISNVHFIHT